ncbi:squalene/phytoene synthase family protein [Cognatiluteimonas weifangensis]|uniref:Phytoene/squalene synthase family protein n=1 Tax=Cognatiluteimonas weifangensis TaxID=2303539 RepID=A0A372DMH5_9GAMM|nr:squalene/phytoene synthase family protein [Luteimonas weifangensis]RFP60778.1 phytoene/squalene synthase family protein [Luteimonas weifangensis]
MSGEAALTGFIDKWRARWPEWRVAEVFVPAAERERALAWFTLRQELTDAAWGGSDPRPGEAKLGWWAEELQGWAQGQQRHPLGLALQALPAPWSALAACLPALLASRERATDAEEAIAVLEPFAEAVAGIAATLFASTTPAPASGTVVGLLAERLLLEEVAVPLQVRARLGEAAPPQALARAWAQELLQRWPPPHQGARSGRIHAALLRARLRRCAAGGHPVRQPLPAWQALAVAWRAARGA